MDSRKYHSQGSFINGKFMRNRPPTNLTITGCVEVLPKRTDGKEPRPALALTFKGTEHMLQLNAGNRTVLEKAWGFETDNWNGKTITVSFDPTVKFGLQEVGGIKVSIPS